MAVRDMPSDRVGLVNAKINSRKRYGSAVLQYTNALFQTQRTPPGFGVRQPYAAFSGRIIFWFIVSACMISISSFAAAEKDNTAPPEFAWPTTTRDIRHRIRRW